MTRPDWDTWALGIAQAASERGDCTRRQVGAVILDADHGPVSFGYNGAEPGGRSCLAGECPRGRHYKTEDCDWPSHQGMEYDTALYGCQPKCACGNAWPCPDAVKPGSSYDTGPGACISVHAEANALLFADKRQLDGATIFITDAPCEGCLKLIKSTPISRIVWPGGSYVRRTDVYSNGIGTIKRSTWVLSGNG